MHAMETFNQLDYASRFLVSLQAWCEHEQLCGAIASARELLLHLSHLDPLSESESLLTNLSTLPSRLI